MNVKYSCLICGLNLSELRTLTGFNGCDNELLICRKMREISSAAVNVL